MDQYVNNKVIRQFKRFIERFTSVEKEDLESTQVSHSENTPKSPEIHYELLTSPSASISEGTLAQFIPTSDFKVAFKSLHPLEGSFQELVYLGKFSEATELVKLNPDLMKLTLFSACVSNNLNLFKLLIDKKKFGDHAGCPNQKNEHGKTVLHIAAAEGFLSICELVVDFVENIEIDARDNQQKTPLHLACIYNEVKIAQLFVRAGAEVNALDELYNTPLHYAYINSNHELIEWLLTKNADANIKNIEGKFPNESHKNLNLLQVINDIEDDCYEAYVPNTMNYTVMIEEINNFFIKPYCGLRLSPDDFKPLALLGKGSFGEVYLVRKLGSNEEFAMKILAKNQIIAEHLVRYALTERNIMSSIKHPFIVALKYSFQTANKLYLILDYCAGGTLRKYLQVEGRFTEDRSRVYLCEIITALEELHRRNIIYRDLKPENVGIDSKGHILLIDFGLSKESVMGKNSAHSFCGSVSYLAPEMLRRTGHGKAVDWYLLGVLLYEIVTGSVPFFSMNNQKMFHNILYGDLKIPQGLSENCKDLLRRLLEKNPDARLGSERGAEEIKEHQFFQGIDWKKVLGKELDVCAPRIDTIPDENMTPEIIYDDCRDAQPNIQGWTFVCAE